MSATAHPEFDWTRQCFNPRSGETWVCRSGWVYGQDQSWTYGFWHRHSPDGFSSGMRAGEASSLEEAQLRVELVKGDEVTQQVVQALLSDNVGDDPHA